MKKLSVKVIGKQPIFEGGSVYNPAYPKSSENPVATAADTFVCDEDRAEVLVRAGRVEVIGEVKPAKKSEEPKEGDKPKA